MNYKIYPVYLGETKMDHNMAYYREQGDKVQLHYGLFVLKNEYGETILVDSGRPSTEEILENQYPYKISEDAPDLFAALAEVDVTPESVKRIILTHLHYDHAWNLEKFPTAEIYVQIEEIRHAILPYKHERQSFGCIPAAAEKNWVKQIKRFHAVYGDEELFPGIRVITTPSHTTGSQSVLVNTAEGEFLLVGDWVYQSNNIERCHPTGSILSVEEWYESYRKIMKLNATILPTHDNSILKRKVYG